MAPKDGGLFFWIGRVSVSDAEKATLADILRTERIGRYQCCSKALIADAKAVIGAHFESVGKGQKGLARLA